MKPSRTSHSPLSHFTLSLNSLGLKDSIVPSHHHKHHSRLRHRLSTGTTNLQVSPPTPFTPPSSPRPACNPCRSTRRLLATHSLHTTTNTVSNLTVSVPAPSPADLRPLIVAVSDDSSLLKPDRSLLAAVLLKSFCWSPFCSNRVRSAVLLVASKA
ncbi:hypothetical protein PIB30_024802 [Stylosanthes scabra]|uniref:Uncharacterized protein n=1 Tax=Stylosanthes scabra TaxID=79078 RepID=A0ABU6W8A8_9FABA|nr:hypothetical protein [Stylosanthes scabra]